MNKINFLVNLAIYIQPLIWLGLLKINYEGYKKHILFEWSYVTLMGLCASLSFYVYNSGFFYEVYNSNLIALYLIMVLFSILLLEERFNKKDSIALAFLIVYMNSLYWELPLHSMALIHGEIVNTFRQVLTHIWFIPILLKLIEIEDKKKFYKMLVYGLIFSTSIMVTWSLYHQYRWYVWRNSLFTIKLFKIQPYLWLINRIGSLIILLKSFMDYVKIRSEIE